MKGKSNTFRPEVGERCLMSGPNMDDDDGYIFHETEVFWKDEKFVLYGNEGMWPILNKWDHIISKPLKTTALDK